MATAVKMLVITATISMPTIGSRRPTPAGMTDMFRYGVDDRLLHDMFRRIHTPSSAHLTRSAVINTAPAGYRIA